MYVNELPDIETNLSKEKTKKSKLNPSEVLLYILSADKK